MQLSKYRDMLMMIEEHQAELEEENPGKELEEIGVVIVRNGEQQEVTVGTLLQLWRSGSAMVENECPECPVNFRDRLVGCYGAINYPLSAQLEAWWQEHFKPMGDYTSTVLSMIEEYELTGESIDAQRPQAGEEPTLYEAPQPLTLNIAGWAQPVTTSQIIELLNFATLPPRDLLWGLLLDFGALRGAKEDLLGIDRLYTAPLLGLEFDKANENWLFLHEMINDSVMRHARNSFSEEEMRQYAEMFERIEFVLQVDPGDDRCIGGFKRFLYGCWLAMHGTFPVLLSP